MIQLAVTRLLVPIGHGKEQRGFILKDHSKPLEDFFLKVILKESLTEVERIILGFLNHLRGGCQPDASYSWILQCIFSTNKNILLYN